MGSSTSQNVTLYLHRSRLHRHTAGCHPGSHRTGLHRRRHRYLRHQRDQLRLQHRQHLHGSRDLRAAASGAALRRRSAGGRLGQRAGHGLFGRHRNRGTGSISSRHTDHAHPGHDNLLARGPGGRLAIQSLLRRWQLEQLRRRGDRAAVAGKLLRGCAITHQPLSPRRVQLSHPEPWPRMGRAISMSA